MTDPILTDDLIVAYVYGELRDDEASAFEASLQSDPDLRAEVEGLMAARSLLDVDRANAEAYGFDDPPAHLTEAIMRAEPLVRPRELTAAAAAAVARPHVGEETSWFHRVRMWMVGGGAVLTAAAALMLMVKTGAEPAPAATAFSSDSKEVAAAPAELPEPEPTPDAVPMSPAANEPLATPKPDVKTPQPMKAELEGPSAASAGRQGPSDSEGGEKLAERSFSEGKRDGDAFGDDGARLSKKSGEYKKQKRKQKPKARARLAAKVQADPAPAPPPPPPQTKALDRADKAKESTDALRDRVYEEQRRNEARREPSPAPAEAPMQPNDPSASDDDSGKDFAFKGGASGSGVSTGSTSIQQAAPVVVGDVTEKERGLVKLTEPRAKKKGKKDAKPRPAAKAPSKSAARPKRPKSKDELFGNQVNRRASQAMSTAGRLLDQRQPKKALAEFKRAQSFDKNRALGYGPLVGKIKSYEMMGRCDLAKKDISVLERAPVALPNVTEGLFTAAACAERLGDYTRARRIYNRLEVHPPARLEAGKRLRRMATEPALEMDSAAEAPASTKH